jgi:hypothetical protein
MTASFKDLRLWRQAMGLQLRFIGAQLSFRSMNFTDSASSYAVPPYPCRAILPREKGIVPIVNLGDFYFMQEVRC